MIKKKPIFYEFENTTFEGILCWDDAITIPKPGILVAPTIRGQTTFEIEKAEVLAQMGYVGFAIDMYGKSHRNMTPEKARSLMDALNQDRALLANRITQAHQTLLLQPEVDSLQTAAIGFCFGGKCVLDLARSGADLKGVVSFHGVLDAPRINEEKLIKASVLVLHGWEDPLATPDALVTLGNELTTKKADWQIHAYGHTGHAFTNPEAKSPEKGLFYQQRSNDRAWLTMTHFFQELFHG